MDKNISLSIVLFVMTAVIATVTSFGRINGNTLGGFGDGDNVDRKFQSWLDKRGFGQPSNGFGGGVGNDYRYFNWKDYLANDGISKRQLNYGPRSFGNFQKYFTNGLQDWRSTYSGMKKREASKEPAQQPSA
ncbi:uncharacterized protein [Littorina saxatilis]|uniref:Uncharacterized protein n=1 Tax=Littorina saxatilis TaxID=31220 RepID=A0AAN9AM30_9CAEN